MVEQKYFKGGRGAGISKYNKINNNSENFGGGARLMPGSLSCGPAVLAFRSLI